MKKMIWCGKEIYRKAKEYPSISFDPSKGFLERHGKLFVVVDIDPLVFQTETFPSAISIKVFGEDKFEFLESATDQEIFDSEAILEIRHSGWIRPGSNPIAVEPLESNREYEFAIYAEYSDQ